MNKRVTMQFADFIKSRLAGGLLCCLVLLAAYLFQMFFTGIYVDAFSSSFYLFAWLILFVGALLWTLREKGTSGLPSEITDWQCIAAFLLIVGDQIYVVMPKEVHVELAPVLSAYTLPVLVIVGLAIAGIVKLSISFYRSLEIERQKNNSSRETASRTSFFSSTCAGRCCICAQTFRKSIYISINCQ